jgi:hypothetical protein
MPQRDTNCFLNTTGDVSDITDLTGLGMHTDNTTLLLVFDFQLRIGLATLRSSCTSSRYGAHRSPALL